MTFIKHTAIIFCTSVLLLSGCASYKTKHTDTANIDVPANWAVNEAVSNAHATSLTTWWMRFDDVLLTQLIQQALQANTNVNSAKAALLEARALRDVAAATLSPTLGSSASAQRSKSGNNNAVNNFKVGLDANWELDIFGANRSGLAASEATALASASGLSNIQTSIAAEIALDYITLRNAQARLAIANKNLASQLETLEITQWRTQAGLVSSLDAEQAKTSAEQTRASIPPLETSIAQMSHALAVLTGKSPATFLAQLAKDSPIPQAQNNLALNFPAETLRQRPDVSAAEYRISAELARLEQADAARLPNFSLGGSLGLNALTLGSLTSGSSVVSSLLANVAMPLFDAGSRRAKVRAQEAVLEQTRFAYKATVLTALQEVEDALVALRGDLERVSRLKLAVEAAGNAAIMANQSYQSGLADFQTVLETQRSLLNTQDSLSNASADVSADHVRLYKALGGGWMPSNPS
ncbi:efflux transporter outer membrane subunit [Methylotenera sp.]|uniref:efflux transporter outer membrane subunit n=1 Tax=Methylotenera sp. TaxID=2051956 RepID=UPI0025EE1AC6|nr:efflux transporter outer membrane subunit [Methylotenera sp.]